MIKPFLMSAVRGLLAMVVFFFVMGLAQAIEQLN